MRYIALLRGINVGGNSTVSMTALKIAFQKAGFSNVTTYINSGNVIFESIETNSLKLATAIEQLLQKEFFLIKTVVISHHELANVLKNVPKSWCTEDLRKYIAFLKDYVTAEDVVREAQPKEDIDFIDKGKGVVYLSTRMGGLTQSNFSKLNTKKIYQHMTMRSLNTIEKLLQLVNNNT